MSFLSPKSIAVIGASGTPGKVGHDIFKNLLTQGFAGTLHPINPKTPEILGIKTTASIIDVQGDIDLAIIVIPASAVPNALRECAAKKIPSVAVISAGFSEVHTEEGKKLEEEIIRIAEENDIALLGPNCLGLLRPSIGMNASFAKDMPPRGTVALISQSGATAVALIDAATENGIGFSTVLSIGNKALLDESDFVELCAADDETKVIGLYLESIKDGRRFLQSAALIAQKKPIVLLKAGTSAHGKKAASSHTGALAGSDSAIDALCVQTGIHRARSAQEFFDLLSVLSGEPPLLSDDIAIITNAGGPGILATDQAERSGLRLPLLEERSIEKLRPALPASASILNPIDLIGDAGTDRYKAALDACIRDPNIDGIAVVLTPQVMTPCLEIAHAVIDAKAKAPLISMVACFMGGESVRESKTLLRKNGIPCFDTPERAVAALAGLRKKEIRPTVIGSVSVRNGAEILKGKTGLLPEADAAALFESYELPTPKQSVARTAKEAVTIADAIGYPVIAKISSPDILHKTDIGGIKANLKTADQVRTATEEILGNAKTHMPGAALNGVLIQQFLPIGNEFIIGALRDPSFGPMIMVGLGGIYTELFRDTAFRIAPVSEREAYEMLESLKSWKLLKGLRGAEQADIDALARTVATVSRLVAENPNIEELDINPVLVGPTGIVIADVKIVLSK